MLHLVLGILLYNDKSLPWKNKIQFVSRSITDSFQVFAFSLLLDNNESMALLYLKRHNYIYKLITVATLSNF